MYLYSYTLCHQIQKISSRQKCSQHLKIMFWKNSNPIQLKMALVYTIKNFARLTCCRKTYFSLFCNSATPVSFVLPAVFCLLCIPGPFSFLKHTLKQFTSTMFKALQQTWRPSCITAALIRSRPAVPKAYLFTSKTVLSALFRWVARVPEEHTLVLKVHFQDI